MIATHGASQTTSRSFPRVQAFFIVTLAATFYVYEFYLRVMPSSMTHELMHEFNIAASGLGWLSSIFFWGYASMQIPAGLLYDRFGPRTLLTIAVFFCGLSTLVFGLTDNFAVACLARGVMGLTSSFAFVGALVLASRWYPAKYFALITGCVQFMGSMGAITGEAPIAPLVAEFGWRPTAIWSAVIGITLSALLALVIRDRPSKDINVAHHTFPMKAYNNEIDRLKAVLTNKQTWAIAAYAFSCWGPISIFAALWGMPFLIKLYGTTTAIATKAMIPAWLGTAFASPLAGWWSDRINNRRIPLIICAFLNLITSLYILYAPNPSWTSMLIALFLFGCAAGSQVVTFGLVQDNHPPSVAGTAVGFNNMAVIGAGVILLPLVGMLLKLNWDGAMIGSLPNYTLQNFHIALLMLPLCGVIGLISSIFMIKETHCVAQYDLTS